MAGERNNLECLIQSLGHINLLKSIWGRKHQFNQNSIRKKKSKQKSSAKSGRTLSLKLGLAMWNIAVGETSGLGILRLVSGTVKWSIFVHPVPFSETLDLGREIGRVVKQRAPHNRNVI